MSESYNIDEVRQAVAARLEALAVPAVGADRSYVHDANSAWRESEEPLMPEWQPENRMHMSFTVDDRVVESRRITRDNEGDGMESVSPVTIRFLFELRPGNRKADWDAAAAAAQDVIAWLCSSQAVWPGTEDIIVRPARQAIVRTPLNIADWLSVEIGLELQYRIRLAA